MIVINAEKPHTINANAIIPFTGTKQMCPSFAVDQKPSS
jgi:hypothetical protein